MGGKLGKVITSISKNGCNKLDGKCKGKNKKKGGK